MSDNPLCQQAPTLVEPGLEVLTPASPAAAPPAAAAKPVLRGRRTSTREPAEDDETEDTRRLRAVDKGTDIKEAREPSPRELALGAPTMIHSDLSAPPEIWALYQAARTDPELAFEGTMSQFLCQCTLALFETLGMRVTLTRFGRSLIPSQGYLEQAG